jgi:hypothetical protein
MVNSVGTAVQNLKGFLEMNAIFNKKTTVAGTIWAEKHDGYHCRFYIQDYTGYIKQINQDEFNYLYGLQATHSSLPDERIDHPVSMAAIMNVVD